jgi:hypothetical protein
MNYEYVYIYLYVQFYVSSISIHHEQNYTDNRKIAKNSIQNAH